ncbi:hypothetical protein O0555_22270 [Brevibacillus laterosporus]|uniref:hypothetical protein n=1 Tax=Brevibacillus laterosporus TaxID=1465 RepID=UPI000CE48672|nr:hypothetical protein [Brevibacillus laterosporus]MCR8940012.1 hypothetical protein [Brevibacillus laterosporus]MCZ0842652.1 hypothetical protein [Brevibacillus laterosporus]MCZ0846529.1 hypothetical protein [Brevibacillus laterosporus]PPA83079.1 hypothetical protein C4A75_16825 [Brevibacillus laterosporus]
MLDILVAKVDEELSAYGVTTEVLLKTERSILEGEEYHEVEMRFMEDETREGAPVAVIHLFPLEEANMCEIEVEVTYPVEGRDTNALWQAAQAIVPEIAITSKKRMLTPDQDSQVEWIADFHFMLPLHPMDEKVEWETVITNMAAHIGKLVRISY